MDSLGKILIISGLALVVIGIGVLLAGRLPWLGRLPGDIHVQRDGFSFHFPIVTCLLLSLILTVILNLFFRNR